MSCTGIGFTDRFGDKRRFGKVIGSRSADGMRRGGCDLERSLAIDNGALRIRPPLRAGFGRVGVAYGPYKREPGLAFGAFMVNGHNTSQDEELSETFHQRFAQWWTGANVYGPRRRILQWIRSGRYLRTLRAFRWWHGHAKGSGVRQRDENLAVGWFREACPATPIGGGNAFVMHATGAENGELWANVGGAALPAIRGVQNLQIYYLVVLRARGAAYYAGTMQGANGIGTWPGLRPIAIDPHDDAPEMYAGIQQALLGQIGFRLDSRVDATAVRVLPELASWFGTAHGADDLCGQGLLHAVPSAKGGTWRMQQGLFERHEDGARPRDGEAEAQLSLSEPAGLIHLMVTPDAGDGDWSVAVIWRGGADGDWRLQVGSRGVTLTVSTAGGSHVLGAQPAPARRQMSLQVLDDGGTVAAFLDGSLLFTERFRDARMADGCTVGVRACGPVALGWFEAHPRVVPVPESMRLGEPWCQTGAEVVAADSFAGSPEPLDGRRLPTGDGAWSRTLGSGIFDVADGAARVRATRESPAPGRTMYTIPWGHGQFADLAVTITPPGTRRGERHHGLSGIMFWQDAANYITQNIWVADSYGGSSISTFFQIDGFDDLYDAIWANVGSRVRWGHPTRLRMVFDGLRFVSFVDGEPVLYRSLKDVYPRARRLRIRRVGLITNWEWGNDTGSVFTDFEARA